MLGWEFGSMWGVVHVGQYPANSPLLMEIGVMAPYFARKPFLSQIKNVLRNV
jgi:hypothetical protein